MELDGAHVFITGGGGGLGRSLARAFAELGATVTTADVRDADVELDVTDPAAVARAIDRLDRLDVVIANAGIGVGGSAHDIPRSEWQRTIDVNIAGVVNTVLPAYERLRGQRHGAIVLTASLAGLVATPCLVPYTMSKHAIVGLGASLRLEAARYGVGVTTVCPGPVETAMLDERSHTPGLSARRFLVSLAGKPLSSEAVARAVVAGVRRDRAFVTPGRAAILARAARFTPRVTSLVTQSAMRRELAHADVPK
jgi:NAD(P)-dependent dehydrogenase (short-subunit alcohol dehydrogenase family)